MGSTLLIVAVTVGGPVGISPEIIPKAFSDPRACRCCGIVIDGRAARVEAGMATTGSPAWKKPTTAPGTAMVAYLNTAIDDAMAARISAIATGPRLP
jgi:4-hydroxy-L-threonine phosphate dehydrogenase PdxA